MRGQKFWKAETYEQKPEVKTCCKCGAKAIYKWGRYGWCFRHKAGAVAAATYSAEHRSTPFPIDDLRLYSFTFIAALRLREVGIAEAQVRAEKWWLA